MNFKMLPVKIALLLALFAFGLTWAIGLAFGVPAYTVAWRSLLAAGAFWILGRWVGRLFLHSLADAYSEQVTREAERATPRKKE